MDQQPASSPLRARNVKLRFTPPPPRHWLGGEVFGTHLANAANLLFPAGERFFVRAVRAFCDRLDPVRDAKLRAQVTGFFAQEGRHAQAHERFFDVLENDGLRVRGFLRWYERLAYARIEPRLSPEVRLAITVALEHYTAIMAEAVLRGGVLDSATPEMHRLFAWHAAEEIEHRAVAFDVLLHVDPRYATRMRGLAWATLGLGGFWLAAMITLLRQEPCWGAALVEAWRNRGKRRIARDVFLRGIVQYIRRDFHPRHNDIDALASQYLATLEAKS